MVLAAERLALVLAGMTAAALKAVNMDPRERRRGEGLSDPEPRVSSRQSASVARYPRVAHRIPDGGAGLPADRIGPPSSSDWR